MHRSVYIRALSPAVLDGLRLLNTNSIFLDHSLANGENIRLLRDLLSIGVEVYVAVPIFSGVETDAHPVDFRGKILKEGELLCPSHEGVRNKRVQEILAILENNVDGIWLDNLCYPTVWGRSDPLLIDTCYCDRCVKSFGDRIGENVKGASVEETALLIDGSYYIEWMDFKTHMITSFAKEVKEKISKSKKKVKLGAFIVPWEEREYGAGIKRLLGQDLEGLSEVLDFFSPMLYNSMLDRDIGWIKEKVEYYRNFGKPFLPFIQTENASEDGFDKSVENASLSPSVGICLYSLDDLIYQREKLARAVELYGKL